MTEELSLEGVVRSFNESSEILDQLRQRLTAIASSDEVRQESSNSLRNSADQLVEVANELKTHSAQVVALSGELGDAAALAKAQFAALTPDALLTSLREQRDELGNVAGRVSLMESTTGEAIETLAAELGARVSLMGSTTSEAIETLAAELATSRTTIQQQSVELATIRTKIAAVPEKARRRHGLDGDLLPPAAP
mgnify:CR=1 FL=1